MKLNRIFYLLFSLLIISCEKEIPLKQDEIAPRIVVNSIFSANDTLIIHLSESRNVLYEGNELPNIDNATATLYDGNNNQVGQFVSDGFGFYHLETSTPSAGQYYSLEVTASGFESVKGTGYTPFPVHIDHIDTTTAIPDNRIKFNISFTDKAAEKNYYSLSIVQYVLSNDSINGNYYEYSSPYFTTTEFFVDNGSQDFGGGEKYAEEFFFSDATFNGQTVDFEAFHDLDPYLSPQSSQLYYVSLNSLSEDLYKYKLTYSNYWNTQGNFFAEPVQVYSNIEKGFGIFGGYSIYKDTIVVQ